MTKRKSLSENVEPESNSLKFNNLPLIKKTRKTQLNNIDNNEENDDLAEQSYVKESGENKKGEVYEEEGTLNEINKKVTKHWIDISAKDICLQMKSKDKMLCLDAVNKCRAQLCSLRKFRPFEQYYKNGVVEILIMLINSNDWFKIDSDVIVSEIDKDILRVSTFALSCMTMGQPRHVSAVFENGGIDIFFHLINHDDNIMAVMSLLGIECISRKSSLCRDVILSKEILPLIRSAMVWFCDQISTLRYLSLLIFNLCELDSKVILVVLSVIYELMSKQTDVKLLLNLSKALFVAITSRNIMDIVISRNFLHYVNCNLSSSDESLCLESINIMTYVISFSDADYQSAVDVGLIISIKKLLSNDSPEVVIQACKLLIIVSEYEDRVMTLVNSGIVLSILHVIGDEKYSSKKEAVRVIYNIVKCEKVYPKLYLLKNNIFDYLTPLLTNDNTEVIVLILKSIKDLFAISKTYNKLEKSVKEFKDAGGIDVIEVLENLSGEVYSLSSELDELYLRLDY